ncbi:hypothetical protein BVY01_01355 [bacterium I07]|nr:hypothetical protein BVY01_01355 [bacterium I07]
MVQFNIEKKLTLWIFILLLVAIGIGFFLPVPDGSWQSILGKIVLFFLVFIGLYYLLFNAKSQPIYTTEEERLDEDEPLTILSDDGEETEEQTWEGFSAAFRTLNLLFLSVIKDALVASNVAFFLKKTDGDLEFQAGENDHDQVQRRAPVTAGHIVEFVSKQKAPVLEGNLPIGVKLNALLDPEIRTFLGAPLIYCDDVVGVLAVGSEAVENFGNDDKQILSRYADLMSQAMTICHRGLRWELDQVVFQILLDLIGTFKNYNDEHSIISFFVQRIRQLFQFERFTFCERKGNEAVTTHVFGQMDDIDRGYTFSLDDGLNGWMIKRNAPLRISDMEEGDYVRPRYSRLESTRHGLRSFMGIPLGKDGQEAWACLSLESRAVDQYSEKAKDVLVFLASILEVNIERIRLNEQLSSLKASKSDELNSFQLD